MLASDPPVPPIMNSSAAAMPTARMMPVSGCSSMPWPISWARTPATSSGLSALSMSPLVMTIWLPGTAKAFINDQSEMMTLKGSERPEPSDSRLVSISMAASPALSVQRFLPSVIERTASCPSLARQLCGKTLASAWEGLKPSALPIAIKRPTASVPSSQGWAWRQRSARTLRWGARRLSSVAKAGPGTNSVAPGSDVELNSTSTERCRTGSPVRSAG